MGNYDDKAIVIMYSGGFDSHTLTHYLSSGYFGHDFNRVILAFAYYGQQYYQMEFDRVYDSINIFKEKYPEINFSIKLLNIDGLNAENVEVKFRNLNLFLEGLKVCEQYKVGYLAMGFVNQSTYYVDSSSEYANYLEGIANMHKVTFITPFVYTLKDDLIPIARFFDVKTEDIWSCTYPESDGSKCGKCGNCEFYDLYNDYDYRRNDYKKMNTSIGFLKEKLSESILVRDLATLQELLGDPQCDGIIVSDSLQSQLENGTREQKDLHRWLNVVANPVNPLFTKFTFTEKMAEYIQSC